VEEKFVKGEKYKVQSAEHSYFEVDAADNKRKNPHAKSACGAPGRPARTKTLADMGRNSAAPLQRRTRMWNTSAESGGEPPHSKLGFVVDGDEADDFEFFLSGGGGDLDFVADSAIQ